MTIALVIPVIGTPYVDKNFPTENLKELQLAVGGYIELVRVDSVVIEIIERKFKITFDHENVRLVVNENGRLISLPINRYASAIAGQIIVGNALLCEIK